MRPASFSLVMTAALLTACGGSSSTSPPSTPCRGGGCVVAISAARSYGDTCALLQGGEVMCWGSNYYGQLGNAGVPTGAGQRSLEPVLVASVAGATAIAVGELNGCAVLAGGEVKCWGDNSAGQLSVPVPAIGAVPHGIRNLSGATQVSLGQTHACALVSGGAAKCWGYNEQGQLGDGTTTLRYDPVTVGSAAGATAVVAGAWHTCAIVAGGAVKCWGYNLASQLGNSSVDRGAATSHSVDPVDVTSVSGAVGLAAGTVSTCALLSSGFVKCWGRNANGQLGTATAHGETSDPVDVGSVTGATSIAAGDLHACAIVAGGAVKCWGWNAYGQLGNGSTGGAIANRSGWTAEEVAGISGATQIAAGARHTCALLPGRGVRCWGYNAGGQLGDGTMTDRLTPVDVVF